MKQNLLKSWRIRIFASTWLCYAGFYFCRKPFYIAKATLGQQLNMSASLLGTIGAAYLIAYAAGQFISGVAGNKVGPRILLLIGMALSIVCNIAFGFTNSPALFIVFMSLNGLAQATGWPGTVGTMANWFHRGERGTVMGFWSTNYQVGGVVANGMAAWALSKWGYQYSFVTCSIVLMAVWIFFLFNQRNKPEDVGLSPVNDPTALVETEIEIAAREEKEKTKEFLGLPHHTLINVLLIGTFYFFLKFIRYALWSWAPFFLTKNFHLEGGNAGYLSTLFDLFGVAGAIAAGVLSDKFFKSQRAGISFIMILIMLASCLLLYFSGQFSIIMFAVSLALVGFTLYGPDALLSGAGAMDVGSKRGATLAAGIINGMGSLGSVVQELAIGKMYDSNGGSLSPVFFLLLGAAIFSTAMIGIIYLRNRLGHSNV